jgi:hypothetical protein
MTSENNPIKDQSPLVPIVIPEDILRVQITGTPLFILQKWHDETIKYIETPGESGNTEEEILTRIEERLERSELVKILKMSRGFIPDLGSPEREEGVKGSFILNKLETYKNDTFRIRSSVGGETKYLLAPVNLRGEPHEEVVSRYNGFVSALGSIMGAVHRSALLKRKDDKEPGAEKAIQEYARAGIEGELAQIRREFSTSEERFISLLSFLLHEHDSWKKGTPTPFSAIGQVFQGGLLSEGYTKLQELFARQIGLEGIPDAKSKRKEFNKYFNMLVQDFASRHELAIPDSWAGRGKQ